MNPLSSTLLTASMSRHEQGDQVLKPVPAHACSPPRRGEQGGEQAGQQTAMGSAETGLRLSGLLSGCPTGVLREPSGRTTGAVLDTSGGGSLGAVGLLIG